jgi:hypothetical protein
VVVLEARSVREESQTRREEALTPEALATAASTPSGPYTTSGSTRAGGTGASTVMGTRTTAEPAGKDGAGVVDAEGSGEEVKGVPEAD